MGGRKGVQIQACDIAPKPGRNRGQPKAKPKTKPKAKPKRAAMGQPITKEDKAQPKVEADKELYPKPHKEFQEDAVHTMPPPSAKAKAKPKAKPKAKGRHIDLTNVDADAFVAVAEQFGPTDGAPNEAQIMALWQWVAAQGHIEQNQDIDLYLIHILRCRRWLSCRSGGGAGA